MSRVVLDLEEWDACLAKMHRYHSNLSEEVAIIVQTIRKEMKSELVPLAEEKAAFGKVVKGVIRELWGLEYEIEEIQTEFAKGIGSIDIEHLTDDFVEDVMLQSKPLQGILMAIRLRQKDKMADLKKLYWDAIKDLEPLKLPRAAKPVAKPEEKKEEEKKADAPPPANPPSAEVAAAPVAEAKA